MLASSESINAHAAVTLVTSVTSAHVSIQSNLVLSQSTNAHSARVICNPLRSWSQVFVQERLFAVILPLSSAVTPESCRSFPVVVSNLANALFVALDGHTTSPNQETVSHFNQDVFVLSAVRTCQLVPTHNLVLAVLYVYMSHLVVSGDKLAQKFSSIYSLE